MSVLSLPESGQKKFEFVYSYLKIQRKDQNLVNRFYLLSNPPTPTSLPAPPHTHMHTHTHTHTHTHHTHSMDNTKMDRILTIH